ncbi:histidine kinase [Nocardioides KLBMP 9356]|uniref:histidine kinase n=1 Tax=Nocardioides potassii TaxID=2911371 RepID=A0ABS9HB41_9ACTN|nr:ATP-binding protein [Nocardioides potassii]MCF6378371.1 histidine kinase [Nocardioides potassii]
MTRLLSGWEALDPALGRLLRINVVALTVATVSVAVVYVAGFRHTTVLVDLAVMAVSIVLAVASAPLARRWGSEGAIGALAVSAGVFAVGGTWATPILVPLTTMLVLVPMLVAIPYVPRRWLDGLGTFAVLGSSALVALAEYRRPATLDDVWWVNAIVAASALPSVVVVVIYLVRDAYRRLHERTEQLEESRTRIVEVADAARRSIERDLHDGAQQRLLAMSVTIERARKELQAGRPEGASGLLDRLATDNREVLVELRELARGIYPPLLTERGLAIAVQATARRSVVPVTLEVSGYERQTPQVEAASYFCILEALTNVAKHAHAESVLVTLRGQPHLAFSVTDDGRGFDRHHTDPGGLLGMEARMAAAGGTLTVTSQPGRGTTVHGEFPSLDASG